MWAVDQKDRKLRHFYRGSGNDNLIAMCMKRGKAPLDYTRVEVAKCSKCEKALGRKR